MRRLCLIIICINERRLNGDDWSSVTVNDNELGCRMMMISRCMVKLKIVERIYFWLVKMVKAVGINSRLVVL